KEPLYDAHARLGCADDQSEREIDIGNLGFDSSLIPANPPVYALTDPAREYRCTVFYDARNGHWTQTMLLRKARDHWAQAIRVERQFGSKPNKQILLKVDKDFPGKPDWKVFEGHWEKVKPLYPP